MKNGSIILVKGENTTKFDSMFSKLVKEVTGSDYVHSALYIDNRFYEFGLRVLNTQITQGFYDSGEIMGDIYSPIFTLTDKDNKKAIKIMKKYNKYNFIKLISMWFIYPLREFWKKINWIPFNKLYYGTICSEAIDRVFKELGYDILPNQLEGYTAPADIAKSKLFRKIS